MKIILYMYQLSIRMTTSKTIYYYYLNLIITESIYLPSSSPLSGLGRSNVQVRLSLDVPFPM